MRLRKSKLTDPGITRLGRGRSVRYLGPDGSPLPDAVARARINALVIPPAWTQVWISPWPNGHIQAVGTDAAGRRQYRYHQDWTRQRSAAKFDRVLGFAATLPALRQRLDVDLARRGMPRDRALAVGLRLLDLGFFRIGNESSAEDMGHFGLTTLRRDHVSVRGSSVAFAYVGKAGKAQSVSVLEPTVVRAVRSLLRREDAQPELLAWREGSAWSPVTATALNERLRTLAGDECSAKDFRTWAGTVLAAVALSVTDAQGMSESARRRATAWAVGETARYLGNTPTVCRASYIHPRLFDLWRDGLTVAPSLGALADGSPGLAHQGAVEAAVLELLSEPSAVRHRRRAA